MIPRWRAFDDTMRLDELSHHRGRSIVKEWSRRSSDALKSRSLAWKAYGTLGHATDLVGAAFLMDYSDAIVVDAARFILDNPSPDIPRNVAWAVVGGQGVDDVTQTCATNETLYARVRQLKRRTRRQPRDAIRWMDLARIYVVLGQSHSASRCVAIATGLAPNNRFILRSACRFWLRFDNPDRAHDLLRRAPMTREDPWLVAAELALADLSGQQSRMLRRARKMLEERRWHPMHLSELSAEVGTMEANAGNMKKAKKRFRDAVIAPTDNTVAQISWLIQKKNEQLHDINIEMSHAIKNAFEARARMEYGSGRWRKAIEEIKKWNADEPFARQPCMMGSHIAAVALEDYSECKKLADIGLRSNSNNFTLLNNLAFAYLKMNQMAQATILLKKIRKKKLNEREEVVFLATSGLCAYRSDNAEAGRVLYEEAISRIKKQIDSGHDNDYYKTAFALGVMNWVAEEGEMNMEPNRELLARAKNMLRHSRDPIAAVVATKIDHLSR